MPNFDGGHYFLSALIPIRDGLSPSPTDHGNSYSHTHALREILSILPTHNPRGGAPSDADHYPAPFSLNRHTHFCRMVVIDDLTFVGRQHEDAILTAIQKRNPVIPGPVDHLPRDFLALIIDFDAPDGSAENLRSYLQELWDEIPGVLTAIFQHCKGFDHRSPQESFLRQVMNGQIETTMSFNDYYWTGEDGLWQGSPSLPNKIPRVLLPPLVAAGVTIIGICWQGGLRWLVQRLIRIGMEPLPTAPRSDLPSVLKALYLQRHFVDFMIANQRSTAEQLQASFRSFLQEHKPHVVDTPSQQPGSIPF